MWFYLKNKKKEELIFIRYTEQGMGWEALEVGRFQVKNGSLGNRMAAVTVNLGWYGQGLGLTAATKAPEKYRANIMTLTTPRSFDSICRKLGASDGFQQDHDVLRCIRKIQPHMEDGGVCKNLETRMGVL